MAELYRIKNHYRDFTIEAQTTPEGIDVYTEEQEDEQWVCTSEIAAHIGCSGETVRRKMNRLEEAGIVQIDGKDTGGVLKMKPALVDEDRLFKKLDRL